MNNISFSMASDILALTKPRITVMAVLVSMAGLMHSSSLGPLLVKSSFVSLLGIAFLVSGASSFNMYLERNQDRLMERTKSRPLPAGRLSAWWACFVGLISFFLSLVLLAIASNTLTIIAGVLAFVLYVGCYTPLKQKSWISLLVGSIPGAMPVVLGYMAISGVIDQKALALFLWAFLWQIPHFLAISLFRESEYTKAGFPVMSFVYGVSFAKNTLLFTSWLLVSSTLLLYFTHIISLWSLLLSLVLGAWFLINCHTDVNAKPTTVWAKKAFKASLIYQSLLFLLLIFEALKFRI